MRRRLGERLIVMRGDWGRTTPKTLQALADEVLASAKAREVRITEVVFEAADEEVLRREPEEALA